jgi:hypothetical protein
MRHSMCNSHRSASSADTPPRADGIAHQERGVSGRGAEDGVAGIRAERSLDELLELAQLLEADMSHRPRLAVDLPGAFLLSVVVPVYNERHTICTVLGSL